MKDYFETSYPFELVNPEEKIIAEAGNGVPYEERVLSSAIAITLLRKMDTINKTLQALLFIMLEGQKSNEAEPPRETAKKNN